MAIDRARLSQPTRIALLEGFEQRTERWREDVDEKMDDFLVLHTKVGIYAAIGGCIGGAIVAGVVTAVIAVFFT